MQEVDLNDAAWNEVVSTRLPANLEAQARQLQAWSRKDLVALYRARWQIELFFKRLQQCLHLHQFWTLD
jgi:IS4 transposase